MWKKPEKSPKGGVGGSEKVTNYPVRNSVQVDNSGQEVESKISPAAKWNPKGEQVETSMDDYIW